jgi:hypothetical protein
MVTGEMIGTAQLGFKMSEDEQSEAAAKEDQETWRSLIGRATKGRDNIKLGSCKNPLTLTPKVKWSITSRMQKGK